MLLDVVVHDSGINANGIAKLTFPRTETLSKRLNGSIRRECTESYADILTMIIMIARTWESKRSHHLAVRQLNRLSKLKLIFCHAFSNL